MKNCDKEGSFFIGIVEDNDDTENGGRHRVRSLHHHDLDKDNLPTQDLPWLHTCGLDNPVGGMGRSKRIPKGAMVIMADIGGGIDSSVIMGVVPGVNKEEAPQTDKPQMEKINLVPEYLKKHDSQEESDINTLHLGKDWDGSPKNTINNNKVPLNTDTDTQEPTASSFPKGTEVYEDEGIIIEKGSSGYRLFHKDTGSYMSVTGDGFTIKSGDKVHLIGAELQEMISGAVKQQLGSVLQNVSGSYNIKTPELVLDGDLKVKGKIIGEDDVSFSKDLSVSQDINCTGTVTASSCNC